MANLGLKRLIHLLNPKLHFQIPIVRFLATDSETPTVSATKSSPSFTVQYLNNSCGLSLEQALSASEKFRLEECKSKKHESVLTLLKSFHFSDSHIKKLVTKCPSLLQSKVHNNLNPKLQFLTDYGFSSPLLAEIVTANPYVLHRSLDDHIKPTLELLKKYLHTNEKVVAAIKRSSRLLTFDFMGIMQPNMDFLLSEGVPAATIAKHIVRQPRTLMMKLDKTVKAVKMLKELGLDPKYPVFLEAIRIVLSFSDSTWKGKMDIFKSFGWSEEEIMFAFKRGPTCFAGSEEKIRTLMDFYLNCMKLDRSVIVNAPKFLTMGLNTRVLPRYNIVNILKSKNLIKDHTKYHWFFTLSEEKFITTILEKHLKQVPDLTEIYRGSITRKKIGRQ